MATRLAALPPYRDPDINVKSQAFQDGFSLTYTRCDCKGWVYRISYLEGVRARRNAFARQYRY